IFLGEKMADDFDLGWMSGTRSTLRNTGSPLNRKTTATSGVPWRYDYRTEERQWQFSDQQIDPATGEVVSATPKSEAAGPADATDEATAKTAEAPAAAPSAANTTPNPDAAAPSVATKAAENPELKPDANGLLPHSRLGGNPKAPLAVGGFASSHH